MRNKKIITVLLCIFTSIFIIFMILIAGKNHSEIIIFDSDGNEYYRISEIPKDISVGEVIISDNYAVDSIISQVINDMEINLGYPRDKVIKILNNNEYSIYSTIDSNIQQTLDNAFNDRSTFTETSKSDFNQAAMVITDYKGNVKAVSGGNNGDNTKNRAATTLLKVGSTIKPVAIYAKAIDNNLINFSTIIPDIPGNTYINGQAIKWPSNYDNRYEGNVTITEALKKSKNTIAVTVGKMVGEEEIYNFLKDKLDYNTLIDINGGISDKQLSALALGYFNDGITLDTLVSSYAIFGNDGEYNGKRYYSEVKDKKGNILISNEEKKVRAITEETATIMNRLLLNNIVDDDSIIKNVSIDNIEVIGKTGTVGNDNDDITSQLFVGMTPDYIAGVWVGYDDERALMQGLYNQPSQIWKNVMSNINMNNNSFELSDNVYQKDYCNISGLLINENCENVNIGYYTEDNTPKKCDICK